jgi:peptidoglycan/LPS O-acetylase OafA/YrhL
MITGFLFWDKALKSGVHLRRHLLSRVRRIYPLYIFSSLFIFSLVAFYSEFSLKVPISSLLISLAAWATGGLFKVDEINGQGLLFLNANVLWTLQYEWAFYLLLPLLALLFKRRTVLMAALYVGIVLAAVLSHMDTARSFLLVGLPLLLGCITAAWLRNGRYVPRMNSQSSVATALCLLVLSVIGFRSGFATVDIVFLMWPLFSMIAAGCNPAGFLTSRSAAFLGKISYGVYMMHGIMLCFIQRQWGGFEANYPIAFLGLFLVAIFVFTGWCQWVFRNIEEPYIAHVPRIGAKEYSVP